MSNKTNFLRHGNNRIVDSLEKQTLTEDDVVDFPFKLRPSPPLSSTVLSLHSTITNRIITSNRHSFQLDRFDIRHSVATRLFPFDYN